MCPQRPASDGRPAACSLQPSAGRPSIRAGFYQNGVGWVKQCLGESQSRFYPHMRAKLGRGPTAVSKKVYFNFISSLLHNFGLFDLFRHKEFGFVCAAKLLRVSVYYNYLYHSE